MFLIPRTTFYPEEQFQNGRGSYIGGRFERTKGTKHILATNK